jgi:hypothetical protein
MMEERKVKSMEVANRKYIYERLLIEAGIYDAYCNQILNLNSGQSNGKKLILMRWGC